MFSDSDIVIVFIILFECFPNREYIVSENKIIQGFITNKGNFVDRNEGYKISLLAGQCDVCESEILTSEDLY